MSYCFSHSERVCHCVFCSSPDSHQRFSSLLGMCPLGNVYKHLRICAGKNNAKIKSSSIWSYRAIKASIYAEWCIEFVEFRFF